MTKDLTTSLKWGQSSLDLTGPSNDRIAGVWAKTRSFYSLSELERLSSLLQKKISPKPIIIDAGANIGNHTAYFALAFPSAIVLSFEVNPTAFRYLEKNISTNCLKNAVTINLGLSSKAGDCGIVSPSGNPLGGAMVDISAEKTIASVVRLDDYLSANKKPVGGRVDLIKIDVEGHELQCLQGARRSIEDDRPLIYLECKEVGEYREISDFLAGLGYVLSEVSQGVVPNFLFVHALERREIFGDSHLDDVCRELGTRSIDAFQRHRQTTKLRSEIDRLKDELAASQNA